MAPQPTYDITVLFRRAENLPIADLGSLSSDPYVSAALHTTVSDRDRDHQPPLRFRTPTQRSTTEPEWEWRWEVSNVPRAGTRLRIEVMDEDFRDHDDRLGHVTIEFEHLAGWGTENGEGEWYRLRKKGASKKAAVLRMCAKGMESENRTARVLVSIVVKGETKLEDGMNVGRAFTVGPNCWSKHHSPLIGKVIHSKDSTPTPASIFSFEANKLQLTGPPPPQLSHNYVGFAPFVTAYFTHSGIRGRLLNHALHSQYNSLYSHDASTEYGAATDVAKRFLEMAHWAEGHRLFTYVVTLDAEWRFTETGDEFAIDLLSKHSLHSDVSRVITYSGEFFVRKLEGYENAKPEAPGEQQGEGGVEREHHTGSNHSHHSHTPEDHDPSHYELVIDNDSGTYRPSKDLLPTLASFLQRSLTGIGKITTYDCMDPTLTELKKARKEAKQGEGRRVFRQRSSSSAASSISSNDEEELETGREGNLLKRWKGKWMMSGAKAGAAVADAGR